MANAKVRGECKKAYSPDGRKFMYRAKALYLALVASHTCTIFSLCSFFSNYF